MQEYVLLQSLQRRRYRRVRLVRNHVSLVLMTAIAVAFLKEVFKKLQKVIEPKAVCVNQWFAMRATALSPLTIRSNFTATSVAFHSSNPSRLICSARSASCSAIWKSHRVLTQLSWVL